MLHGPPLESSPSQRARASLPRYGAQMAAHRDTQLRLPLRIVVVAPPRGVWFSLQPEPGVFEQRCRSGDGDLTFELEVRVGVPSAAAPRLLGAHVKGPPDKRFVYLGVGKHAGDVSSCWDRRIKVPLGEVTRELVEAIRDEHMLEARIAGTGRDGGPACATVPLLAPGWRWRRRPGAPRPRRKQGPAD